MSMQKVSSVTLWAGCQSLNVASSDPMKKRPPGTRTIPSGHVVRRAALLVGGAGTAALEPALEPDEIGRLARAGGAGGLPNMRNAANPPAASATTARAPITTPRLDDP